MPSLDTNILLRLILLDDTKQVEKVKRLLKQHDEFAIADTVVYEIQYILGGYYEYSREEVADVIHRLMNNQHINMNRRLFERALRHYRKHLALSFADCCLEAYALLNNQVPLYTLDKKLANQLPHTKLVQ